MCNGSGAPFAVSRAALDLLRAAHAGEALPPLPEVTRPTTVPDVGEYVGLYTAASGVGTNAFEVAADGDGLVISHGGTTAPLAPYWDDFVAAHPDFERFVLRFDRDKDGRVVGATHGGDRYAKDGLAAPPAVGKVPVEWRPYAGRYRSHNPWIPFFVVVPRGDRLWLIFPAGEPDGFEEEQPLVPLDDATFHVGEDPANPERIGFDAPVDGLALRATLSGADYWRSSIS